MKNKIFYIAIASLCFWVVQPIFFSIFNLELVGENVLEVLFYIKVVHVPVAIMSTITYTYDIDKNTLYNVGVFVITIALAIIGLFLVIMSLFSQMCAWTDVRELYMNTVNPNHKIIERSYGCGAIDSSPTTYGTFKVKELTSFLIWAKEIDIDSIDENEWVKINQEKGD